MTFLIFHPFSSIFHMIGCRTELNRRVKVISKPGTATSSHEHTRVDYVGKVPSVFSVARSPWGWHLAMVEALQGGREGDPRTYVLGPSPRMICSPSRGYLRA